METHKKLFISYRRNSWPAATRLYEAISRILDAEIFMDFKGIDQDDFETAILTHLQICDVVMVVVTELTFAADRINRVDDWVRREIREALLLKKPIVLACIDGLFPPADLPDDILPVRSKEGKRLFAEFFDVGSQQLAEHISVIGDIPLKTFSPSPAASSAPTTAQAATSKDRRDKIEALIDSEDYAQAVFELEALIESGFKSTRYWNANVILQDAMALRDAQARHDQMLADYAEIVRLDRVAKLPSAKQQSIRAWQHFLTTYPDFADADDHAQLRAKLSPASKVIRPITRRPAITAEQQRLLDMMLDWQHYDPPQRAEAGRKLADIGDPRPGVGLRTDGLPDIVWCEVPGGKAQIGGDKDAPYALPAQEVNIPTFYITKYPITYHQFHAFLYDETTGFTNDIWWKGLAQRSDVPSEQHFKYANHPRDSVSWYDAVAFSRWLSSKLGDEITLPTEQQWEKAARGTDGSFFPWGNQYKTGYANIDETATNPNNFYLKTSTAVGIYPQGQSLFELCDLNGNVWEWTLSEFAHPTNNELSNDEQRTIRGGSWSYPQSYARAASRNKRTPNARLNSYGFRLVARSHPPF